MEQWYASSVVRLVAAVSIFSVCSHFHLLAAAGSARFPSDQIQFFENRIRPVLRNKCAGCHNEKLPTSGLSTDSREAILRGGNRGEAVASGLPEESRLVHAIRRQGELKMPPEEPLADHEVSALVRWIRMGLPWPAPAPDRKQDAGDPSGTGPSSPSGVPLSRRFPIPPGCAIPSTVSSSPVLTGRA